ncbi:MAG: chloride channel protein [Rheinheimera sp.]|nr:chloride channel protein [Rheinheimera sp.]
MNRVKQWLPPLRRRLALPVTSLQLCLLGALGGLVAALLIVLFRLAIMAIQSIYLTHNDDFTSLSLQHRALLPFIAAALITVLGLVIGLKHYRLGIPFVIHRIKLKYGLMPWKNTLQQFFGGVAALSAGFSVGREGPSVHLGAFGASMFGKYLRLPYNSIRILAGCGIAAGISASFNTPLAAVIFVMEVVLREYRIHVFVPIMLASTVGALVTQSFFGTGNDLHTLTMMTLSNWHLPYLVLAGVAMGVVATFFNQSLMLTMKTFQRWHLGFRLLLAALLTAAIGSIIPQALGAETGAIHYAVSAPNDLLLLFAIFVGKILLTVIALGLGVPGGIVGPVFGIGIVMGTILAFVPSLFSGDHSAAGTYALLGMAGMMAATLHAPLAALVAVMELASNPQLVVPSILVITASYVTAVQFFHTKSIFLQQLDFLQLPYKLAPADDVLQKVGVLAMLQQDYVLLDNPSDAQVIQALDGAESQQQVLVRRQYALDQQFELAAYDVSLSMSGESALRFIPVGAVSHQATMAEVFAEIGDQREGAVLVYDDDAPDQPLGLISWEQVRALLMRQNNLL